MELEEAKRIVIDIRNGKGAEMNKGIQAIDTVLKELERKDKVINLMCMEYKENFNIDECKKCLENPLDESVIDKKCTDCMKEYFYKQVEVEDE